MYKGTIGALLIIAAVLSFLTWQFGIKDHKDSNSTKGIPKDWVKFVPFTGKFKVYLPKTPKYAIDIVNVPNTDIQRWYEIYASEEVNGTTYLINLISYHPDFDLSDVKGLLRNVVNEIVSSNFNNRVVEIKHATFQDRQSIFFHIQNETIQVKGVAFLVGQTVYLLTYTATAENFDENEFHQFINSFGLLKTNEVKEEHE